MFERLLCLRFARVTSGSGLRACVSVRLCASPAVLLETADTRCRSQNEIAAHHRRVAFRVVRCGLHAGVVACMRASRRAPGAPSAWLCELAWRSAPRPGRSAGRRRLQVPQLGHRGCVGGDALRRLSSARNATQATPVAHLSLLLALGAAYTPARCHIGDRYPRHFGRQTSCGRGRRGEVLRPSAMAHGEDLKERAEEQLSGLRKAGRLGARERVGEPRRCKVCFSAHPGGMRVRCRDDARLDVCRGDAGESRDEDRSGMMLVAGPKVRQATLNSRRSGTGLGRCSVDFVMGPSVDVPTRSMIESGCRKRLPHKASEPRLRISFQRRP